MIIPQKKGSFKNKHRHLTKKRPHFIDKFLTKSNADAIIKMNRFIKTDGGVAMPKKIDNVREMLLSVAKQQIQTRGYKNTTVRSVAAECGLGVGTVYNYFASKDMLIATFMLEDWQRCLCQMQSHIKKDTQEALCGICVSLACFIEKHRALFSDEDAQRVFATALRQRHGQLRAQLSEIILPLCEAEDEDDRALLSELLSESLITFSVEGRAPAQLSRILGRSIKKEK